MNLLINVCVRIFEGLESWLFDSGELTVKEHLPVRQLRIGDTGSPLDGKKARYTLGPLVCEGDSEYCTSDCVAIYYCF